MQKKRQSILLALMAILFLTNLLVVIPVTDASVLFSDNFENTNINTMSPWTGFYTSGGAVNVSTDAPYSGVKNFESYLDASQTTSWAVVYKNITGYNFVSISCELAIWNYVPASGTNQFVLAFTQTATGTGVCYAGIQNKTSDKKIYWTMYYYNSGVMTYAYGSEFDLEAMGFKLRLEVYDHLSEGNATLYVNDAAEISVNSLHNSGRLTNYAMLGYAYSGSGYIQGGSVSHYSYFYCDDAIIEGVYVEPPPIPENDFIGFSSYPESMGGMENITDLVNYANMTIYRMSFSPSWVAQAHPYNTDYIDYFLANTNATLIVDRNHLYPPGQTSSNLFDANYNTAIANILTTLSQYPNNTRVMVELVNECTDATIWKARCQQMVTAIRNAHYNNSIVANKWTQSWAVAVLDDPLDNIYYGMHFYFNSWSVSGAIAQMEYARSLNLRIINTEVGANYNEEGSYTQEEVNELQEFLTQCSNLGIGNCVWLKYDTGNWDTYLFFGLEMPTFESEDPDDFVDPVWLTVFVPVGGIMNITSRVHIYERGTILCIVATASQGYVFQYFTIIYTKNIRNPLTFTVSRNMTLNAYFRADNYIDSSTRNIMAMLPIFLFIGGGGIALVLIRGRH